MKWARIVKASHAAGRAARESAASRKRISREKLVETERRKKSRPRGLGFIDEIVEHWFYFLLGALIIAMISGALHR